MYSFYFLVPMLIAIIASMFIVRVGAIALMLTGLSFEKAKFQSLSAFSGTGFTTREAERVVNHPLRRKIVTWLMILGNAGLVTVIVTATSSIARSQGGELGVNALVLVASILFIVIIVRHTPIIKHWENFVQARLEKLKIFDEDNTVDELLHITEGYGVVRIGLSEHSALIGQTLSEVNSALEHSLVLGIERDKEWIPTPRINRKLMEDDFLVIYGKLENLAEHFG